MTALTPVTPLALTPVSRSRSRSGSRGRGRSRRRRIAGIDMSAAFDTINRETLLNILEDIVNEDEHRIIRFLLNNTIIDTKIIGGTKKKKETNWQTTKKLGTLLGDQEDIERRKQLSSAALVKLKNVWLKEDKITKNTKLKLYKALVKSVLTYNCGTWAPTQSQEERLNAFHRKQLKKVLNIKYPVKITNSSLYNKCSERPLSIFILESRWRLFGHILRRDSRIPANQAMSGYFVTEGSKFKGRPLTTLPVVLNRDLS
ncbi:hypothetical protein ElyMa_000443100 [Elysia marginata]|uniref:Reverse transcriptase domain-containing protein n=1 Tax=Elysia marginata TaxID=1093978 RepID=A0AAV4FNS1_9GAST|nr:hypothetical protein ElyMa_000443100 [Elysia marginata]